MRDSDRMRVLAERYQAATGEHIYSGRDAGKRHYFADGVIYGDAAALYHLMLKCQKAGVPTE